MRKSILIFSCILLFCGCRKINDWRNDKLHIKKQNYYGIELKLNGYYYQEVGSSFFPGYFLYRDGIILSIGGIFSSMTEMDDYINKVFIQGQSYKNIQYFWGDFKINGSYIAYELWYAGSAGEALKVYTRAGTILNDTTFVITESYRIVRGKTKEYRAKNEIFHFKAFSPKPDSTNSFVK